MQQFIHKQLDTNLSLANFDALAFELRNYRKRHNLTLEQAADKTESGVDAATLSRIENQKVKPKFETVCMLADWMGVPMKIFIHSPFDEYVQSFEPPSTIDKISSHINNDPVLSEESKGEIINAIKALYQFHQDRSES